MHEVVSADDLSRNALRAKSIAQSGNLQTKAIYKFRLQISIIAPSEFAWGIVWFMGIPRDPGVCGGRVVPLKSVLRYPITRGRVLPWPLARKRRRTFRFDELK